MRISSAQIFTQGLSALQTKQQQLQKTELQLSSGLKIMKPSDDPSAAVKILNLNSNIDILDQYNRNIKVAETALAYEESVMANVTNSIQRIRELAIQGNNSTNSDADRASIATEVYSRLDELLTLANTRDANGEYIFAGNRINAPAFANNGGNIEYLGDQGQRMIQVGQGNQITIRNNGNDLFQSIPAGNGQIQVEATASNAGTLQVGSYGINSNFVEDTYTLTFSQATLNDPVSYVVSDSATPANVISSGIYDEGETIGIGGAQITFSGQPVTGDTVVLEPAPNKSLFESVKRLADALNTPTPDAAGDAHFYNEMSSNILSLDQALSRVNNLRAGVGARLNNLDSVNSINQDFKLQLETVRSDTQDLDYAEAISRFNLQLTALQAAQQAFVKTSNISLFQYL